jgi:hypothetical protein
VNTITEYERRAMLFTAPGVVFALLLAFNTIYLDILTKEYPLPDRVVGLPAPNLLLDSAKAQAGARGLVVYAEEPMSFDSPANRGFYLLYGYVEASRALDASLGIYARAKDPGEDPTCRVLVAPLPVLDGVVDSTVYVCEEGQNDLRVASTKFANASLSSFCSLRGTL